jgi:hypothetical protein
MKHTLTLVAIPLMLVPLVVLPLLLLPLVTTSCFSLDLAQDPPSKSHYLLAAKPTLAGGSTDASGSKTTPAEATANKASILQVNKAYVAAPFHEKSFVYRIGENQYTSDYYHEVLVSPSQMVTQLAVDWLRKSRAWPEVHHSGQAVTAARSLDLNLLELYGDYRQLGSQQAVVRLRATLWAVDAEDGSQRSVFGKEYTARVDIPDREGKSLVAGMNQALEQVLGKLSADLRDKR